MTTPQTPVQAGVSDTGPLDWRIGIVDNTGRPTPEFQRRWNQQRNNNNLIRTIQTGSGPPTDQTAVADQVYIDTTATPFTFYIFENGSWTHVGVVDFTDLGDVPHSYTGFGLSLVRVNASATALEFIGTSGALDSLGTPAEGDILYRGSGTWQFLAPGTSGNLLQTNGPGAIPSWVSPTAGSGTVTSVAMTLPSFLSVTGSPITTSGTLAVTLATESAHAVFAGPTTGSAATPTFRSLVSSDLPVFSSSAAGIVPLSGGGTVNFLRADGTWAVPPGTGGGGGSVTIKSNGTTLTTGVTSIDFTTNMTATAVGTAVTVSASGGGGGGGGTPPTVRGSNIQNGNASSYTVTWPTGTVAGDLAVILAGHGFGVNSPSGWIVLDNQAGSNANGAMFAKVLTSTDITTGSVTITTGGGYFGIIVCVTFVGATTALVGFVGQRSSGGGSPASVNASTVIPGAWNLYFGYNRGTSIGTWSSGTVLQSATTSDGAGAAYIGLPAAPFIGTGAYSSGSTGSGYYIGIMVINGP